MFQSAPFSFFKRSANHFSITIKHFVFTVAVLLVCTYCPVESTWRSGKLLESNNNSGGGVGSYIMNQLSSSLFPTSATTQHHQDKALISAQFRANPDYRDSIGSDLGYEKYLPAMVDDEDNHLGLAKYLTESETTYSPSKMRLNLYSQTGFYNPYPNYVFPPNYYSVDRYSYRDPEPSPDSYAYYESTNRIRDLPLREKDLYPAYGSGRNGYGGYREGSRSTDQHYTAMGSEHGGSGGGGGGWGHHYTSKVNTNAIGLLGLLGLLSLLSNVLLQLTTTTTTTTAAMRALRKRSTGVLDEVGGETRKEKRERIFNEVLPHLTPIAFAKNENIPVNCTFHGVCMANKILVEELGLNGRLAGQKISKAAGRLLGETDFFSTNVKDTKSSNYYFKLSDTKKTLESAGLHGRNKKECEILFPVCTSHIAHNAFPFEIKMKDLPKLIDDISRLSKKSSIMVSMNL